MRILIFHHHRLLCIPNDAQQHALRQFQLCHRAQTLLVHACEQRIPREEGSFCLSDLSKEKSQMLWHDPL